MTDLVNIVSLGSDGIWWHQCIPQWVWDRQIKLTWHEGEADIWDDSDEKVLNVGLMSKDMAFFVNVDNWGCVRNIKVTDVVSSVASDKIKTHVWSPVETVKNLFLLWKPAWLYFSSCVCRLWQLEEWAASSGCLQRERLSKRGSRGSVHSTSPTDTGGLPQYCTVHVT